jgi:hypothetical protein
MGTCQSLDDDCLSIIIKKTDSITLIIARHISKHIKKMINEYFKIRETIKIPLIHIVPPTEFIRIHTYYARFYSNYIVITHKLKNGLRVFSSVICINYGRNELKIISCSNVNNSDIIEIIDAYQTLQNKNINCKCETKFECTHKWSNDFIISKLDILLEYNSYLFNYKGAQDINAVCDKLAGRGHFELLKWAKLNNYQWSASTCTNAATNGRLDMLEWSIEQGCPYNNSISVTAAENNHLDILKWIHENKNGYNINIPVDAASFAALNGHIEIVKWIHENGYSCNEFLCSSAGINNHFEIIKWAFEKKICLNAITCYSLAIVGNLEMLKWSRQNNCPWDNGVYWNASCYDHPHIILWAYENGCPIDGTQKQQINEKWPDLLK